MDSTDVWARYQDSILELLVEAQQANRPVRTAIPVAGGSLILMADPRPEEGRGAVEWLAPGDIWGRLDVGSVNRQGLARR